MTKIWLSASSDTPPKIAQSRVKRDWMDETYKKHAYQCMPLTVANVHGWEVQLEEEIVVEWDGHTSVPRVLSGAVTKSGRTQVHQSIIGTVTFSIGWAFKTEAPYSMWISGSPNYFVDGAVPLTATIPTWWWPDEFQMNWKITKVGEPVVFPAGMPICFFNIYDDNLLKSVEFETFNRWEDKDFIDKRIKYGNIKAENSREWIWSKGIKSGVDADGDRIGPTFTGLPQLNMPE
ncbi:MAG: hypothetical protein EBY38_06215 [Flavobacteriaceae bacterium]|jgi:hypothetical protein|nr:hypothetical protein [Flavobacteriaceae bacterium]